MQEIDLNGLGFWRNPEKPNKTGLRHLLPGFINPVAARNSNVNLMSHQDMRLFIRLMYVYDAVIRGSLPLRCEKVSFSS